MQKLIDPEVQAQLDLQTRIATLDVGDRWEQVEQQDSRFRRDSNTGRITHGDYGSDEHINVMFTTEAMYSKKDTVLNGRVTYIDVDFVTIITPANEDGKVLTSVHSPVTDFYIWRFPKEYARFKEGKEAILTGTPLSAWPLLGPSDAKQLEAMGVRTVEQLAALPDSNTMRGIHALKTRAKQFMADSHDNAAKARLQVELDERDKAHKAEVEALKNQMAQVMAALEASKAPAPTKETAPKAAKS